MRGPLLFLVWQSLVNRILSMLRKMKRPKYAISVLFGAGYIWWFVIRPMSQVGQVSAFDGGQAAHTLIVQSVVGLLFIVMLLLQTLSSERGLAYQENELLFLLVAPVSRAGLLRLKLIQSQPGILLSSMFMGYVVYRMPGGSFWALGFFVLLTFAALTSAVSLLEVVASYFIDELNGPRRMEVVWDGLVERGYFEQDVERVMGRNLYRLYAEVIG